MSVTWYRALTISGKDAGLRFWCDVCGLGIAHSAPTVVRHCGRDEHAPRNTEKLETFRLGWVNGQIMFLHADEGNEPPEPEPKWWI